MTGVIMPASTSAEPATGRWPFIDHAYCLTLTTRGDRQNQVLKQLNQTGLLGKTSFVVSEPASGPKPPAIFGSHCQAARHASAHGYKTVLILEDDATFLPCRGRPEDRVERNMQKLPAEWHGLYLGHFPLRAYFVAPGLLRASSGCSHAYIARQPLLDWLGSLDPATDLRAGRIELDRLVGQGIDAALARRPQMYACFPMLVTQGNSPSSNIDGRRNRAGGRRRLFDKYRYSAFIIRRMRLAERIAVILSPWHWATRNRWLPKEEA